MPQVGGDGGHGVDHPVVEHDRLEPGQRALGDAHPLGGGGGGHEPGQVGLGLAEERLVCVAEIHGQRGGGCDHVYEVGMELQATDGGHLAATHPDCQLANVGGDGSGHVSGVVPEIHRRGAGVVGLAGDGQLGPRDSLDPGDGSDGYTLGLQHRSLLHVEFHEGPGSDAGAWGGPPVADAVQLLADHRAVDAHDVQSLLAAHAADVDEAAQHVRREAGALLVGEEGHGERVLGPDPVLFEGLDHLEAG